MKLAAFRDKDRTHLQDLIEIDAAPLLDSLLQGGNLFRMCLAGEFWPIDCGAWRSLCAGALGRS
jgi:hypothetical protein